VVIRGDTWSRACQRGELKRPETEDSTRDLLEEVAPATAKRDNSTRADISGVQTARESGLSQSTSLPYMSTKVNQRARSTVAAGPHLAGGHCRGGLGGHDAHTQHVSRGHGELSSGAGLTAGVLVGADPTVGPLNS
jgi:hypothetical protein